MSYRQTTAFLALFKASLKSLLKIPTQILFNLVAPLLAIGALHYFSLPDTYEPALKIGLSDSTQPELRQLHRYLSQRSAGDLCWITDTSATADLQAWIKKGAGDSLYLFLNARNTAAENTLLELWVQSYWQGPVPLRLRQYSHTPPPVPAMLLRIFVFIVFASSVFGAAFSFFHLKRDQVFKFLFTTPIRKINILLAEIAARFVLIYGSTCTVVLVGVATFNKAYLTHYMPLLALLLFMAAGIMAFLPYGLLIAHLSKHISTVPLLGNIFCLPQIFLSGLVLDRAVLPSQGRFLGDLLPLTHLLQGVSLSFSENFRYGDLVYPFLYLCLWAVSGFYLNQRCFKWAYGRE